LKVVSVNIGERTTIFYNGKEEETGIYKYPVQNPIYIERNGVNGDHVVDKRYHGGVDKACYAYGLNGYDFWKKQFPDLEITYGIFGENLTIAGLDETNLFIGQIFSVGEALIQVSQPRIPCYKLGIRFNDMGMVKQFQQADFSGVYFRVLQDGHVQVGDDLFPEKNISSKNITVAEVYSLFKGVTKDQNLAKKALEDPFLSESIKTNIRGFLEAQKKKSKSQLIRTLIQ
jgi:MOSC domain-containing protein YiiM